jgi:hypothetical protein
MDIQEEKKLVEITPLPETNAPPKKQRGRPRKHEKKEKVESHAFTEGRKHALEKGRVKLRELRAQRKVQDELDKKEFEEYKMKKKLGLAQKSVSAPAHENQGYHFNPSFDPNASLRQSDITTPSETGGVPYHVPNAYTLTPDYGAQLERMSRIETLLTTFLSSQNTPAYNPQNPVSNPESTVSQHKSTIHNKNPFVSRRKW